MKVQDFAYRVSLKTFELLERTQHYKFPDELKKEITSKILADLDAIIKESK